MLARRPLAIDLARAFVEAADAVMVGDSFKHDVLGAMNAGMRAVLLNRGDNAAPAVAADRQVPVIHSLRELPELL